MAELVPITPSSTEEPRKPIRIPQKGSWVRFFWPAVYAILLVVVVIVLMTQLAHGGGPRYVAGASYFNPSTKGTPLTWTQGAVNYYADQGDLSSLLPQASADAFVADAFSRWSGISTAALATTQAGRLAEDVSGQNVIVNSDGTISMPADILPSATKPLAIVYDADGKVTDALLGQGAGGPDYCFTNAVYGGPDNLSPDAHIVHALVILNGNCATTSNQLIDLKYRLVRVLGRTLGLDWSQANLNIQTRKPAPGSDDFAGFSIMHGMDETGCVPISVCYPNADQPKEDDRAAISRLYPVTAQNQSGFPGKQLFFENRVRIHGSIHFVDENGQPAQPMQGVNVVARWIDPGTGNPSRAYVATSVSGFLFHGNVGNPVTGAVDSSGQPLNRFGSDDTSVEGFFDLAGLEIPDGSNTAQYQLTVEALDPLWSQWVGPYGPWQVLPSGVEQPIIVTASKGGDLQQDLMMQGSALQTLDPFGPEDFSAPAPVPAVGEWNASLSGYGDSDYLHFYGQANRTLSVEVTAMDETGSASESKARPVIGMWGLADPPGTVPGTATPMAFNTGTFGVTRLDASLLTTGEFRVGISDYRGDGRPDFGYRTRVFYGDTVTPARASVRGGTSLLIQGLGFRNGLSVAVGPASAPVLAVNPNQVTALAPGMPDGIQNIVLSDPSGSTSVMTGVLTFGAGPNDGLRLLSGANPATPVGGEAPNPISVRVLDQTGTQAVPGASVVFTSSPSASFSACSGASSCTVLTDDNGEASTRVTPLATGASTLSAVLAPASYSNPKTVQTTLQGTSSTLDIVAFAPHSFVAQSATVDAALTVRVLSKGSGVGQRTVNYAVTKGTATLSATTTTTDSNGYSHTTLHIPNMSADVQVSACVEPGDKPCQSFTATSVPTSQLGLVPVSGSVQVAAAGTAFQPLTIRITDSASPADPVLGATVVFLAQVFRLTDGTSQPGGGDGVVTGNPTPVLISSTSTTVASDANGLATLPPITAPCAAQVALSVTAGGATSQFSWQSLWPAQGSGDYMEERGERDAGRIQGERPSE